MPFARATATLYHTLKECSTIPTTRARQDEEEPVFFYTGVVKLPSLVE